LGVLSILERAGISELKVIGNILTVIELLFQIFSESKPYPTPNCEQALV
jgi:hypothetical protein